MGDAAHRKALLKCDHGRAQAGRCLDVISINSQPLYEADGGTSARSSLR